MEMKKRKSGVHASLYRSYRFEDHIWHKSQPQYTDLLELSNRCVLVDGDYYIRQGNGGHWVRYDKLTNAVKEARNKWIGGYLKSGTQVDEHLIETFFNGFENQTTTVGKKQIANKQLVGSCPNIQHSMVIPMGPQFVIYNKDTYLNMWHNEMIDGDITQAHLGMLMLELVYRSLCNGDSLCADKREEQELLLTQVLTNQYTNLDFKFVMNWLAAIYQRPGINLQTNLWFCGEQNGVGKGTLVDVMRCLLGSNFVGQLNQTEIEAGWNDHLMGKMLIESNEFDTTSKMSGQQWNKWIKAHCNESTLSIRQRNVSAKTVLNIGNYIFTTNDESPVWLDKTDRRNQLIKTTDDRYWKEFASIVRVKYVDANKEAVAEGFGWILDQVQVDMPFISSAFVNTLKAQILADSQNIVERWIQNDTMITRNHWRQARDMYDDFKTWMKSSEPGRPIETETAWGKLMSKSARLGVEKRRSNTGVQYIIGEALAAEAADREQIAQEIGNMTGDTIEVQDYDEVIAVPEGMDLTPMERLRVQLQRKND
jgi:hypothetical protein